MDARNPRVLQMIISYVWAFLIIKVDTVYLDLSCPAVFVEGSNTITCKINSSYFTAPTCYFTWPKVLFKYTKINMDPEKDAKYICTTPNVYQSNQCPTSPTMSGYSKSTCFCVQRNGDIITYELQFQASKIQHENSTLSCKPCLFQEPEDVNIMTSCRNITFEISAANTTANISMTLTSPAPLPAASSFASRIGLECAWMAWVILVSLIGQGLVNRLHIVLRDTARVIVHDERTRATKQLTYEGEEDK